MPFTPVHILAVVPVGRAWPGPVPYSALAIGSMVPDWPLYTSLAPAYATTHSFVGILIACVPFGCALYLFFQFALKQALYELLPQALRERLVPLMSLPPFRLCTVAAVIAAVAVGALTHIVWDAFTHRDQWGVALVPALEQVAVSVGNTPLRGYKLLQHGSTVIGAVVLLFCCYRWFRTAPTQAGGVRVREEISILPRPLRLLVICGLILTPVGFGALAVLTVVETPLSNTSVSRAAFTGVTSGGLALVLALGAYGAAFSVLRATRGR